MTWTPIRCQEKCPIGKRCCFGEVQAAHGNFRERHKCSHKKQTGREYVLIDVNGTQETNGTGSEN